MVKLDLADIAGASNVTGFVTSWNVRAVAPVVIYAVKAGWAVFAGAVFIFVVVAAVRTYWLERLTFCARIAKGLTAITPTNVETFAHGALFKTDM